MSRLTKIAPSKLGEMRFPKGSNEDFDPKVTTWTMTKEEMEEYFKNEGGSKMKVKITQENYEKLKAQGLNDATIARRWGVNPGSVNYHKKKWYGDENAEKTKGEVKVEKKESSDEQIRKLNDELIAELERIKSEREEQNTWKQEQYSKVVDELNEEKARVANLEALVNEMAEEKDNLVAACEDLEDEVATLKEHLGQKGNIDLEEQNKLLRKLLKEVL